MDEKTERAKVGLMKATSAFLVILSLVAIAGFFLTVQLAKTAGNANKQGETISVTGTAEIYTVPDVAEFSFTIDEVGKTVKDAQDLANKKLDKVKTVLKDLKIADKDVQTTNFNIAPKYEYYYVNPSGIRCYADYCPPPYYNKQSIVGQEATWNVSVKVRDIEKAGDVLASIGEQEVQYLSGLSLVVEKQKDIEKDARDKAIEDAHNQAKRIAKGLGVRLGSVVSFNEYGGGPIMYGRGGDMAYSETKSVGAAVAPMAAQGTDVLPGENKIVSNVTVVYEIK